MDSLDFIYDGNILYNYDGKTECFPVGPSYNTTIGSLDSTTLGAADSYKIREEISSKEAATLGVYGWTN